MVLIKYLLLLLLLSETGSCCVTQADFDLQLLFPLLPKYGELQVWASLLSGQDLFYMCAQRLQVYSSIAVTVVQHFLRVCAVVQE